MIRLKSVQVGNMEFDLDCKKQHEYFTYKDTTLSKATLILGDERKYQILQNVYDALCITDDFLHMRSYTSHLYYSTVSLNGETKVTFASNGPIEININNKKVSLLNIRARFAYITDDNIDDHLYLLGRRRRDYVAYLQSLLKDFDLTVTFSSDNTITCNDITYDSIKEFIRSSSRVRGILKGLFAIIHMQVEDGIVLLEDLDSGIDYETLKELWVRFLQTTNGRIIATSNDAQLLQNKDLFSLCNIQICDGNDVYKLSEIDDIETVDDLYKAYINGKLGGVPDYTTLNFDQFIDKKIKEVKN